MDVFPSVQPEHLMEFHLEVQAKYFSKDTLEILLQQPNEVRNWGEFDLLSTPLIPSINPAKYALLLQKYAMPQSQGMFASVHTRQQKSGAVPVSGAQLRPEDACASVGNFCESPTSDEEPEGRGKASVMVQTGTARVLVSHPQQLMNRAALILAGCTGTSHCMAHRPVF